MQPSTFAEISDLSLRISGQNYQPQAADMMKLRLAALCRREGFANIDDLQHCLKERPNPRFELEVAAALTGKTTHFFADKERLEEIVTRILPERLVESKTGRLRIWCAGVSTGQEVWSLAMRLAEATVPSLIGARIEIVGTDISAPCIEQAKRGAYGHFEIQKGISIQRLMQHFTRQDTEQWHINPALRTHVSFRQHNLLEGGEALGLFDVIICRNVLAGMARARQALAISNLRAQLLPGAELFLDPEDTDQLQSEEVNEDLVSICTQMVQAKTETELKRTRYAEGKDLQAA